MYDRVRFMDIVFRKKLSYNPEGFKYVELKAVRRIAMTE